MNRQTLLEARAELGQAIRASEEWSPSYKTHQASFNALLRDEAALEAATAEYLHGLAERAPTYVDWTQVPAPLKVTAASTPLANKDEDVWAAEMIDFNKAIIDAITMLTVDGAQYGQTEYGIELGVTDLTDWILTAASEHTAALVSQVTDTNRKLIQNAIKQGIKQGEDTKAIKARISKYVSDPDRAELIAQTESVNSYQSGLLNFGIETGAKTKTWEALDGACTICAPLGGETVKIDQQFSNGVDAPSAHPRCRCGVIYNY